MKALFEEALQCLNRGEDIVLETIIVEAGSAPRGVGAHMIVQPNGRSFGTIGGGAVEYEGQRIGSQLLKEKRSMRKAFDLSLSKAAELGMVCGGKIEIYFQYISNENKEFKDLCNTIITMCDGEEDAWLFLDISREENWNIGVYSKSTGSIGLELGDVSKLLGVKAQLIQTTDKAYHVEPIVKASVVYIFGGGHVSQELVPVLTHLDFKCVVLDDRDEFVNKALFPTAKEVAICDFANIENTINIQPSDYVVAMTRGHQFDYEVQAHALKRNPKYIGIIGSRNKIAFVTKRLLSEGFTKEEIEECHTPIGLAIGAETPAEIAISIAGELIQVRATDGKRQEGDSYE